MASMTHLPVMWMSGVTFEELMINVRECPFVCLFNEIKCDLDEKVRRTKSSAFVTKDTLELLLLVLLFIIYGYYLGIS